MRWSFAFMALSLTACGSPSPSEVGEVTRDEAAALNDAAQMLDDNAIPPSKAK